MSSNSEVAFETLIVLLIPGTSGRLLVDLIERAFKPNARCAVLAAEGYTVDDYRHVPLYQRRGHRAIVCERDFGLHVHVPQRSHYATVLEEPAMRMARIYREIVDNPHHREKGVVGTADFEGFLNSEIAARYFNGQTRALAGGGSADLERALKNVTTHSIFVDLGVEAESVTKAWAEVLRVPRAFTCRTANDSFEKQNAP